MSWPAALPGAVVSAALEVLRHRTGLVSSKSRQVTFEAAVARVMRRAGRIDPEEFPARLARDATLLQALIAEVAVGETYFFRDPAQFALIRDAILPTLGGPEEQLRVWSAGCATGEETLSLAILLHQLGRLERASIVGTDLVRSSLAAARRARYGQWSFRGVAPELIELYFRRVQGKLEPIPAVRQPVEFRYLNLAEDEYPGGQSGIAGMDLILCRNVLIYLDAEAVARVVQRLLDSLSDRGWLLLGAADPPVAGLAPCEVLVTPAGLAYRQAGAGRAAVSRKRDATPPSSRLTPAPLAAAVPSATEPVAPDGAGEAMTWYAARNYEKAAAGFERRLRQNPDDPATWALLIRSHANRGALIEAGLASATALDRHPLVAELVYLHALLLGEAGHHAEAAAAARRALYLDSSLAVAHLLLGSALTRLGEPAGAERAFANAERQLSALPDSAIVPASDGESAGRLAAIAQAQRRLARRAIA
jgi:chemotaxis protein methyltransferase CheR